MKKQTKKLIFIFLLLSIGGYAQVKSGPMLGYSEMREVLLWIQTTKSEKVKFGYWEKETPANKFYTDEVSTNKDNAFVAKSIANQVIPGKKYQYEVWISGKLMKFLKLW